MPKRFPVDVGTNGDCDEEQGFRPGGGNFPLKQQGSGAGTLAMKVQVKHAESKLLTIKRLVIPQTGVPIPECLVGEGERAKGDCSSVGNTKEPGRFE